MPAPLAVRFRQVVPIAERSEIIRRLLERELDRLEGLSPAPLIGSAKEAPRHG